jgi:hypothetical protein
MLVGGNRLKRVLSTDYDIAFAVSCGIMTRVSIGIGKQCSGGYEVNGGKGGSDTTECLSPSTSRLATLIVVLQLRMSEKRVRGTMQTPNTNHVPE